MGDRAIVIFKSAEDVSPTVYLHWGGGSVPDYLDELSGLMDDRRGDVAYASARFTAIACKAMPGNLSVGLWNTGPETLKDPEQASVGDAGVVVVDCANFTWKAYGGYLEDYPNI